MNPIQVLFLGTDESIRQVPLPENVQLEFSTHLTAPEHSLYDLVILDRTPTEPECALLHRVTRAHTLFVTEHVEAERCRDLCRSKLAWELDSHKLAGFLKTQTPWFFPDSYGEKYQPQNLSVSGNFTGEVFWDGSRALRLTGSFGETMTQAAFWRNDVPVEEGQTIDFWLEYKKTDGVELSFRVVEFSVGAVADIVDTWDFSEEEINRGFSVRARQKGFLFVSLSAKGSGTLEIIALHDRHSRGPYGFYMPGGERYLTSQREEIFCYFDPGDRKPPLNVYFSGYKTREGFEGYHMMRKMGAPFLLISDARLEGGAFYMGSAEYEKLMASVLRKYMHKLGFAAKDVILSGISMGSTGALYYGCDIRPHAVIVGKPLANLGTMAANEKRNRPGGFPTSLDLLLAREGELTGEAVGRLDERFWQKFEHTDWSDTKFIASYMKEDDYDRSAYDQMVTALSSGNASIYGRGLHGRHNDNTHGIVQWFSSEFRRILKEDFAAYDNEYRQEVTE